MYLSIVYKSLNSLSLLSIANFCNEAVVITISANKPTQRDILSGFKYRRIKRENCSTKYNNTKDMENSVDYITIHSNSPDREFELTVT
ncbi:MAG: hypothetical protein Q7S74_04500 [Nanoarchaeota archaeon]|nr:hypothetical protein [Nanoarchaeota archaeon]